MTSLWLNLPIDLWVFHVLRLDRIHPQYWHDDSASQKIKLVKNLRLVCKSFAEFFSHNKFWRLLCAERPEWKNVDTKKQDSIFKLTYYKGMLRDIKDMAGYEIPSLKRSITNREKRISELKTSLICDKMELENKRCKLMRYQLMAGTEPEGYEEDFERLRKKYKFGYGSCKPECIKFSKEQKEEMDRQSSLSKYQFIEDVLERVQKDNFFSTI
jgi:hypothetical protein